MSAPIGDTQAGSESLTVPTTEVLAPTIDSSADEHAIRPGMVSVVPQSRIGRFAVLRPIGHGGMGSVFAAYDEALDRKVAIKILHKPDTRSQLQRALLEARALARVCHPNVVAIHEVGQHQD